MSEGIKPEVKRAFDDILSANPFNVDLTKVQPSTSLAKMSGTLRSNQATTELTRRIVEVFGSKTGLDDLFDNFRDGSDPSEAEVADVYDLPYGVILTHIQEHQSQGPGYQG